MDALHKKISTLFNYLNDERLFGSCRVHFFNKCETVKTDFSVSKVNHLLSDFESGKANDEFIRACFTTNFSFDFNDFYDDDHQLLLQLNNSKLTRDEFTNEFSILTVADIDHSISKYNFEQKINCLDKKFYFLVFQPQIFLDDYHLTDKIYSLPNLTSAKVKVI